MTLSLLAAAGCCERLNRGHLAPFSFTQITLANLPK